MKSVNNSLCFILSVGFLLVVVSHQAQADSYIRSCKYEDVFGFTQVYSCPKPGESRENKYCCGTDRYPRCCDKFMGLIDDATVKKFTENAGTIVGIVIAIVVAIIIGVLVCCCCCSCCLLNKMRTRRGNDGNRTAMTVTTTGYPQQQATQYASHHPYPTQQQHYPAQQQQQYPAQQQYSQQQPPYPQQPAYPTQPVYGSNYPNPGYPIGGQTPYPVAVEQPPPYSDVEKQPPFNPNYQQ